MESQWQKTTFPNCQAVKWVTFNWQRFNYVTVHHVSCGGGERGWWVWDQLGSFRYQSQNAEGSPGTPCSSLLSAGGRMHPLLKRPTKSKLVIKCQRSVVRGGLSMTISMSSPSVSRDTLFKWREAGFLEDTFKCPNTRDPKSGEVYFESHTRVPS